MLLWSLKSSHDLGYAGGVIMAPKYIHILILEPLEGSFTCQKGIYRGS